VNRTPNPKALGAFITVAGILLVAMVLFFGSASIFRQHARFILFFDQSVNGLNVGSPVKFRGVPIGSVDRILIRAEGQAPESTAIPVIIKVDRERLEDQLGGAGNLFQPKTTEACIESGLVAQLSLESFITGQLFVEFSVEPSKVKGYEKRLVESNGIVEIPTLGSPLDEVTDDVVEIVTEIGEVDFHKLTENLNAVLENLAATLGGIDSENLSRSIAEAADSVSAFVDAGEMEATLDTLRATLEKVGRTVESYDLKEGPMADALSEATERFGQTLTKLDRLVENADAMVDPESVLRYELENTLRELGRAARSIRALADYLERNPNALVTGRAEKGKVD